MPIVTYIRVKGKFPQKKRGSKLNAFFPDYTFLVDEQGQQWFRVIIWLEIEAAKGAKTFHFLLNSMSVMMSAEKKQLTKDP